MIQPASKTIFAAALACLMIPAALAQQASAPVRIANAQPGEVRVLVAGALRAPLEAVRAEAQKAVGKPLVIEYGASRGLQAQIEADQAFEVALLTKEVNDAMVAKGKIRDDGQAVLASVVLSVGQRGQASRMDISTPEAVKATLLGAKAIRYYAIGASVPSVERMFGILGVGDDLKDRILLLGTQQPVQDPTLGPGEYELILNLVSEVIPMTGGWVFLGPVPEQFQIPVVLVAGIGATGDAEPARALIAFLQGPAIEPALKSLGMTR